MNNVMTFWFFSLDYDWFFSLIPKWRLLLDSNNSMKDILHTGDYLIFQECSRLKLGDIIRYRTENGWYAHRIVWIGIGSEDTVENLHAIFNSIP